MVSIQFHSKKYCPLRESRADLEIVQSLMSRFIIATDRSRDKLEDWAISRFAILRSISSSRLLLRALITLILNLFFHGERVETIRIQI